MSHSQIKPQREIDSICNRFEDQWTSDTKTDWEFWLDQIPKPHRTDLLYQLLEVDFELKKKHGIEISPSDYSKAGPLAEAFIHERLNEDFATLPDRSDTRPTALPNEAAKSKRIGNFKLLQQIGEGGMGSVWMADQEQPVRRRVAIKLIKSGLDSKQVIARFEAERQALALMDHQNIAKVLDAGMSEDGIPFFAMELVQGIAITDYCDQNRLTPAERLDLFIPVCNAVQHAHQKGIVHRDLKPSNVLVTLYDGKPVPKVIDFGLAKALQHELKLTDKTMFTEFGQVVGTLQYMSPEQAEMNALDIDARADIYSLGVILYELLTGTTPLEKAQVRQQAMFKVLEQIRDFEPPRPSTRLSDSGDAITGISSQRQIAPQKLQQILRGELDWIVMKAIEKDRTRRYASASQLAQDVDDFLHDEPVSARPPSATYRLQKFARKNRGLVRTVSAIMLILMISIVSISWLAFKLERMRLEALSKGNLAEEQFIRANESRRDAETQRKLAEESLDLAVDSLVTALAIAPEHAIDASLNSLEPFRSRALPTLRENFESSDGREKLNVALALAHFNEPHVEFLISQVDQVTPEYYPHLLQALRLSPTSPEETKRVYQEITSSPETVERRIKLAITHLNLTSSQLYQDFLFVNDAPTERTIFLALVGDYIDTDAGLNRLLNGINSTFASQAQTHELQYGAVLTIGRIDPNSIGPESRETTIETLRRLLKSDDNGIAMASQWVLTQWNIEAPNKAINSMPNRYQARDGIVMNRIEAGTYERCTTDKLGLEKGVSRVNLARQSQNVTITSPFYLSSAEVTYRQFQRFYSQVLAKREGDDTEAPAQNNSKDSFDETMRQIPDRPYVGISWVEAVEFCNWLSSEEGMDPAYKQNTEDQWVLIPESNGYRLPTEGEWELACRAGSKTEWSFGGKEAAAYQDLHAYIAPTFGDTSQRMPNRFGLFDMLGNAAEWCHDRYEPMRLVSEVSIDPVGPSRGDKHVVRGGSKLGGQPLLSSYRDYSSGKSDIGFRVARSLQKGS